MPARAIIYHEIGFRNSFGNQYRLFASVVVDRRDICKGEIESAHVAQAGPVSADNNIRRDAMPASTYSSLYSSDGHLRRRQPEKHQCDPPSAVSARLQEFEMTFPRTSRLNRETLLAACQSSHPLQHHRPAATAAPSGLNGDNPRAISSTLINSGMLNLRGTTTWAAVVLPAPLGPPRITSSFTRSTCSWLLGSLGKMKFAERQVKFRP